MAFAPGRYLTHFKKIVRDRRVFEDNQVDLEALQSCLASVTEVDDAQEVSVSFVCVSFHFFVPTAKKKSRLKRQ